MRQKLLSAGFVLTIILCGYETVAQEPVSISGIVTTSGKFPLNKVRLQASKSGAVSYSDSTGIFEILCNEKDVLLVAAGGFHDKSVKLGKQKYVKLDLAFINTDAAFNNAIEGGHISENDLRNVVRVISEKNVKDYSKYTSIFELIASEIYDVRVSGTGVYLKVTRSMSSNPQVLYVVDDQIMADISHISPFYVKSIEFIDDVGATMWGSKGANGVLKIYLK